MSDNTNYPYPVILSVFNNIKCLYTVFRKFAQLCCSLQDVDSVQNTANPLSGRTTHYVQIQMISEVQQIYSLVDPDTVSSLL